MPRPELLEFFRTNSRELPETAGRWFVLPNRMMNVLDTMRPGELQRRLIAGEDINALLGLVNTLRSTPELDQFIDQYVTGVNRLIRSGGYEKAINSSTTSLVLATEQFSGEQLVLARKKIFEGRAIAQGRLAEGSFASLPNGDNKLKGFCGLSAATDLMRADLESGYVTGRSESIAACFGYAGMELLVRKAYEKLVGQRLSQALPRLTKKLASPRDDELRRIQTSIIQVLIAN